MDIKRLTANHEEQSGRKRAIGHKTHELRKQKRVCNEPYPTSET
jgi:hypothetical protein